MQLQILPPPPLPPPKRNNVEGQLDHSYSRLNNIDQGGLRGGVIAVLNPRNGHPLGDNVQNLTLFVQNYSFNLFICKFE